MRARRLLGAVTASPAEALTAALIALLAVVVVWNAFRYPAVAGYDAEIDIQYARTLVTEWRIPTELANYYTPPGFFLLAGPLVELGDWLGLGDVADLGQLLDGALTVGTAVLLAAFCSIVFPGRAWLRLAAVAFFVSCPIVLKTGAMFHPQSLVAFLATLALVLTARLLVERRYGLGAALGLGLVVGAGQLVRSVGLWTLGVVGLVLLVAALTRREERRRAIRSCVVVVVVGLLVALPWYAYLQIRYSNPILGRSSTAAGAPVTRAPARAVPGVWAAPAPLVLRPVVAASGPPAKRLWFFVDPGLPAIATAPHRDGLAPSFWPLLYTETWGDYFGVWAWGSVQRPLTPTIERRLEVQSLAGVLPTFLTLSGLVALMGLSAASVRSRPELLLIPAMAVAAFAGTAYYAHAYPTADGDTVKALFLLPAFPALAACFGFALSVIGRRSRWSAIAISVLLAACALSSLSFGIFR